MGLSVVWQERNYCQLLKVRGKDEQLHYSSIHPFTTVVANGLGHKPEHHIIHKVGRRRIFIAPREKAAKNPVVMP